MPGPATCTLHKPVLPATLWIADRSYILLGIRNYKDKYLYIIDAPAPHPLQLFEKYLLSISPEDADQDATELRNVNMFLKALFVQQIYDDNAYFMILNKNDAMLKKVIDLDRDGYSIAP